MFRTALLLTLASACLAAADDRFTSNVRQLTFEGRRAGEGYFSTDGDRIVFQSERDPANPFYQIFRLDLTTGDTTRISNGVGKTTCAWVGPGGRVLFASTHHDPTSAEQQQAELDFRASGQTRRYSWDYDPQFELYAAETDGSLTRLTDAAGYDAEGSFSPDGRTILFASNRDAYVTGLTGERKTLLERDPSYFIDLYRMDADGSNVERLTDTPGYDGGPFFSPDGGRICWRRFGEDGATAEIMTAAADGKDVRQLTKTGAMSWAPFYHPSGEYLIYTTNVHGFANFELYLVRADGGGEPVRVTETDGFDGLPVFHPDGDRLAWTSNRTADKTSQIFIGDWDHAAARTALGLSESKRPQHDSAAAYRPASVEQTVRLLTSAEMNGRLTGTGGERKATAAVADLFDSFGLEPGGPLVGADGFFDPFEFTAGVSLGEDNAMVVTTADGETVELTADEDFRPLAFSATGDFEPADVVFAGYGIRAPSKDPDDLLGGYDSFVHLDVTDKWVLVFRFLPEDISPETRQELSRYASLRRKAMVVRDLGGKGLLVASGPSSKVKQQLVPLRFDGSLAGTSIPVVSITDETAMLLVPDLAKTQGDLDGGELAMGELLEGVRVSASLDIEQRQASGRNVLGVLRAGEGPTDELIVVGAHIDHLGTGGGNSLAKDEERGDVHHGADDNASGVAAMLAVAESLAAAKADGLEPKRDVVFAAWSGEELGLLGASAFLEDFEANGGRLGDSDGGDGPRVVACLNMDMVGRLRENLVLQGVGSSDAWRGIVERRNVPVGLPLQLSEDSYIPTDASAFYARRVPILSAFTGNHEDYHTPRDTADKLNYGGIAKTARLFGLIARDLATRGTPPAYVEQAKPENSERKANLRAYLGTIPDYAQTDVKGVKLSGVSKGAPAAEAGVRGGDVITSLAGKTIENIYDYTFAIEALKIGQAVPITVERGGRSVELTVTPASRD